MPPTSLFRTIFALLLFLPLVPGCQRGPRIPRDAVARVGDRFLTESDLQRYIARSAGTEGGALAPEASSALLDQYIDQLLISSWAPAHGGDVPPDKAAEAVRNDPGSTLADKRDQMRREKLIANLMSQTREPTEAEIRADYTTRQQDFRSVERVRARQILVRSQEAADQALAELAKGRSFESVSGQFSVAANRARGGDIGFVGRGDLPRVFEDEIFALAPGQVSKAIRADSAFHIFRVDDHQPPGVLSFEAAAPLIRERLKEEALRGRINRVLKDARGQYPVTVYASRLPFRYSGTYQSSKA